MAEEFHEAEVVFLDNVDYAESEDKRKKLRTISYTKNAVPLNIPVNISRNSLFRYSDTDFGGENDEDMVPPHVIIGRRVAGKMTSFSVCTGNGRTLKGRDLSKVRNSILRMTGFLET